MYCCKDDDRRFKYYFGSSWAELLPSRLITIFIANISAPSLLLFSLIALIVYAIVPTPFSLATVVAIVVATAACMVFARRKPDTPRKILARNEEKGLELGLLFILHERLKSGRLIAYQARRGNKSEPYKGLDKRHWNANFGWLGLLGPEIPSYAHQSKELDSNYHDIFVKRSDIDSGLFARERLLITAALKPSKLVTWTKDERETLLAFIEELRASDRRLARGFLYLEKYCSELASGKTREQALAIVCRVEPKVRENIRNSVTDQIQRGANEAFNKRLKKGVLALIDRNI